MPGKARTLGVEEAGLYKISIKRQYQYLMKTKRLIVIHF